MRKHPMGYQQVLEKKSSEMEKPLDTTTEMWYNKRVEGEGRAERQTRTKNFQKKFEKPLDKPPKVWYNKYERGEGKPHKPERETQ